MGKPLKILKWWVVIGALFLGGISRGQAQTVGLIKIKGVIGPATATYIIRAIDKATSNGDEALVIQLDTPGGLLDSTKEIVQKLFDSKVPTVVYVAPSGANAASAGTFITLAAHVAAMAPNTSIGAAHPVSMSGGGGSEQSTNDTMKEKLESYASSWIETIATKRKRNAEWAKSAVTKSASITAEKALELKVIDVIATDIPELLQKINGRKIDDKTLRTANAQVVEIPMVAREKTFQLLWRPEVMFVLMLIAIYGIIGELSNPGAVLPGVVGAIALVLALYMAAILPINVAGLALIAIAVVLFVIDIFAPTHGVMTVGGIVSFFLGSLMLFEHESGLRLSLALVIPATILTAAFFLFVIGAGLRAQLLPIKAGRETMLGKTAPALSAIDSRGGRVFVEGEYWNATSDVPIEPGQFVEIVGMKGLTLFVKPKT
jgi:membrane-bound serine protease (ClpP class)